MLGFGHPIGAEADLVQLLRLRRRSMAKSSNKNAGILFIFSLFHCLAGPSTGPRASLFEPRFSAHATHPYRGRFKARPEFNRMETTMTKSKITTATVAALALAGALAATSGSAQAHSHWGGVGLGIAAGALIGAAVVSFRGPVYVTPGYRDCRLVERYDRWGNVRVIRVCDY